MLALTNLNLIKSNDLEASTPLVSYIVTVSSVSTFLALFFVNKIIDFIGTANAIFFNIIIEAGRLAAYSLIKGVIC